MDTLRKLYAYNAWANGRMFAACRLADPAVLDAPSPGTVGTLAETVQHLVGVEEAYSLMMRGESLANRPSREHHDLEWFATRSVELEGEYAVIVAHADDAYLATELRVPWFDFPLTKHDGLVQVLNHSAQHRAQVLSALGAHGVDVPDVDYVLFVEESQQAAP